MFRAVRRGRSGVVRRGPSASRARRGAEIIEFALVMPVLVLIAGVIANYGWYFHRQVVLTDLVADAIRVAATAPADSPETPEQIATEEVTSRLQQAGYTGATTLDVQLLGTEPDAVLSVVVTVRQPPPLHLSVAPEVLRTRYAMRLEDQHR